MKYFFSILVVMGCSCMNSFSQKAIVSSSPTLQDKFSKKSGNIRFTAMTLKIGQVRNNETKSDTIRMFNSSAEPLHIVIGKAPAHIEAHVSSTKLPPKSEGWISVKYDASKRNDYGFVVDRFELITDDSVQSVKTINVQATIMEYFPPMTADDFATVQKATINETFFNYGKIKQGDKVSHKFMLVNEGKRDLIIRKIKTTCTCLKSAVTKNSLPPKDTAYISVDFDSKDKEGKDSRKLSIFLNDPAKPEVVLEMKGEIVK